MPGQNHRYTILCKRCNWHLTAKMTFASATKVVAYGLCLRCHKHGLEAHSDTGPTLTHTQPGQLQATPAPREGETTNATNQTNAR